MDVHVCVFQGCYLLVKASLPCLNSSLSHILHTRKHKASFTRTENGNLVSPRATPTRGLWRGICSSEQPHSIVFSVSQIRQRLQECKDTKHWDLGGLGSGWTLTQVLPAKVKSLTQNLWKDDRSQMPFLTQEYSPCEHSQITLEVCASVSKPFPLPSPILACLQLRSFWLNNLLNHMLFVSPGTT